MPELNRHCLPKVSADRAFQCTVGRQVLLRAHLGGRHRRPRSVGGPGGPPVGSAVRISYRLQIDPFFSGLRISSPIFHVSAVTVKDMKDI